jgi:PBP1b-binding outer membrane lipoprotein LpoB
MRSIHGNWDAASIETSSQILRIKKGMQQKYILIVTIKQQARAVIHSMKRVKDAAFTWKIRLNSVEWYCDV